jgi:hypothetical protein
MIAIAAVAAVSTASLPGFVELGRINIRLLTALTRRAFYRTRRSKIVVNC